MTDKPLFDDLTLGDIADAAKRRWLSLAIAGLLGGVLGYSSSYLFEPRFTSEALLVPVDELLGSGQTGGAGGVGGLVSLIGGAAMSSRDSESLATLQSRVLIESYVNEKSLIPILFADKWDAKAKVWKTRGNQPPSPQDAFTLISKRVLKIKSDSKTGLIAVSIEWTDPEIARTWLSDLVARANKKLRTEAIERGERNLTYLNAQLQQNSIIEIRTSIYRLIESEIKKVMFAQGSEDYAFRFVDPPFVPEKKSFPNRAVISITGSFTVLLLTVLSYYFVALRAHKRKTDVLKSQRSSAM